MWFLLIANAILVAIVEGALLICAERSMIDPYDTPMTAKEENV